MNSIVELRDSTKAGRCLACAKCTTMCPLERMGDYKARLIFEHIKEDGRHHYEDELGRCLTCGACELRCPQSIKFTDFVRGLRELVPRDRHFPCPHGAVLQSTSRMMAGNGGSTRSMDWLDPALQVAESGEVAVFVGCLPLFDMVHHENLDSPVQEIANSAIYILNKCGVKPVVTAQERCCGHDLLWSGERETFTRLAEANLAHFAELGVKQIITPCAECTRTWRLDYPGIAPQYRPEVLHMSEYLAGWIGTHGVGIGAKTDTTLSDGDGTCVHESLGQFRAGSEMEVGEHELSRADLVQFNG
jgi:heterodisulfide reductase subunit D